jgi:hypothetical protein
MLIALLGTLFATQALAGEAFEVTVLRGGGIAVVSGDGNGEIHERVVRESPDPPPAPPEPEPSEEPEAPPMVVKVVQPTISYGPAGGWPVVYFSHGMGRPDHDRRRGFDRHRRFGRGVIPRPGARGVGGHWGGHRGFGHRGAAGHGRR